MIKEEKILQQKTAAKNCGESCGCSDKSMSKTSSEKPVEEIKADPTRFGDWEVNGRAIDF
jgi:hypothetical protein